MRSVPRPQGRVGPAAGRAAILMRMTRPQLAVTVATRIYAPEGSAAAFRLRALVAALDAAGYRTTVFTSQPRARVPSTPRVRRLPVLRDRSGAVRGYVQYASFDIPLFFRLLFGPRADLIAVEPPPTTGVVVRVVAGLRRTPYAYFAADVSHVAAAGIGVNPLVVAVLRRVERWVLRGAALVLAVSDGVRNEMLDLDVRAERVTVVGSGIDTEQFSPNGPLAAADYPYLVYAGTMSEIQGASVLIEAFAKVAGEFPRVRLRMFGSGVNVEKLKTLAERLAQGRVDFPGAVGGLELATWLRGAHAGLASMAPERGYLFAHATKAFATLGCGTPVIYAGDGVTADVIAEHSLGWVVAWDVDEVAAAMRAALSAEPTGAHRSRYSAWVERNFSLGAVGTAAVAAIDGTIAARA